MDRVGMLKQVLEQNPKDAFARYGLAMEYTRTGELEPALQEFGVLLKANPNYTAAYFQAAQALARADRVDEARKWLHDGISCAERVGDAHAKTEMSAMLEELG